MEQTEASTGLAWVPQACTLPMAEQPLRVAAFERLLGEEVQGVERVAATRLHLDLRPEPQVAGRAAELAAAETKCCSFFTFTLTMAGGSVGLDVAVPPGYVSVLDALAERARGRKLAWVTLRPLIVTDLQPDSPDQRGILRVRKAEQCLTPENTQRQMAIESQPGAHDADPEGISDKRAEQQRRQADRSGDQAALAEPRDRSEYYDTLRAIQQTGARDGAVDAARSRSGWDTSEVSEHVARPGPDSIHVNSERATHILDGDRWGGGHRHGTGRPGKTEFPADWDDKKVVGFVQDVARAPDGVPILQPNHRWRVQGERDGVTIFAIVQPDGKIWSAWPEEGSPGVIRNPVVKKPIEGQR